MPKLKSKKKIKLSLGSEREDFIEQFKLIVNDCRRYKKSFVWCMERITDFNSLEDYADRCEELALKFIKKSDLVKYMLLDLRTNEYIYPENDYIFHHYENDDFSEDYNGKKVSEVDSSDEEDNETYDSIMDWEIDSSQNPSEQLTHPTPKELNNSQKTLPSSNLSSQTYSPYSPPMQPSFLPVQNYLTTPVYQQQITIKIEQKWHITQPVPSMFFDPPQWLIKKNDPLLYETGIPFIEDQHFLLQSSDYENRMEEIPDGKRSVNSHVYSRDSFFNPRPQARPKSETSTNTFSI